MNRADAGIHDGRKRRIIFHIDMDAFFASVEQVCDPALQGKPVMVCGGLDKRTVVAAAAYPAREYGIRSGTPLAVARVKCPDGVFIEGDPEKYVYTCLRLNMIFEDFSPIVERYSIDESFIDVTDSVHLFGGPVEMARRIKRRVRDELGLTRSLGIGGNKLLAKMGSKLEKPDGLTVIMEEDVAAKLHPLPVGKLFGVGGRTERKLRMLGVETIGQLACQSERRLQQLFGVTGPMLARAANGIDDSPVITDVEQPPVKSVGNGYTLNRDTRDREVLDRVLLALCAKVGRRLRKGRHAGRTVTVKVRFFDFTSITRGRTEEQPLDLDKEIYEISRDILDRIARRDAIRMLGVSVSNLIHGSRSRQRSLFDHVYWNKYRKAIGAVDSVRDRYGERSLVWGRLVRRSRREATDDDAERPKAVSGFLYPEAKR